MSAEPKILVTTSYEMAMDSYADCKDMNGQASLEKGGRVPSDYDDDGRDVEIKDMKRGI